MEEILLQSVGLTVKDDGVYFSPPKAEKPENKTADFLHREMLRVGVLNVSKDRLEEVMEDGQHGPVKIADRLEEYNVFKDDYIRVTVSRDRLEAYLDVTYPGTGDDITLNDVMHKVYEAGVVYNLDHEKIQRIVKNRIFAEHEVIARGKEPVFGEAAQIVYEVDTDISQEPLIMDDGSVDFRQVSMLKTVEKDQLLAVKIPATKGTDGVDVLGEAIDSTGKDLPLPAGKNTYISEDGLSLYAQLNGRIMREQDTYHVENLLALEGDIDFSTGNIDFNGDVAVGGDVLTGFKVKAQGDIRIKGTVEGAEVVSTEGSVVISRGIVGQEKARILSAKNVRAEFINEATVEAGNDVEVGEYAIGSTIVAGNDFRATEGRGMVIGGKVYADRTIEIKVAGSPNNVRTELRVGGKVDKAVYEQLLFAEKDVENLTKQFNSVHKDIEFIELLKKKLPKFPEKKAKELKELVLKLKLLEEQVRKAEARRDEIQQQMGSNVTEEQKKIAINTMHRGVIVGIDQNKLLAEYTYKLVLVQSKEGEMKINYKSRYV